MKFICCSKTETVIEPSATALPIEEKPEETISPRDETKLKSAVSKGKSKKSNNLQQKILKNIISKNKFKRRSPYL